MRIAAIPTGACLVLLVAMTVGCQNNNSGADKAVESIVDTRVQVVKAQNELYDTLKALDGLQNPAGDVTPAYQNFKSAMEATDRQKKIAERRAVAMRQNSAAYQKQS